MRNESVWQRRSVRPRSRLFHRLRGDRLPDDAYIELSGIQFARDRWISVSNNYRRMLDDLFLIRRTNASQSSDDDTDTYCAVLEDDLVVAPDALIYLQV
jgi:hypothetical protein